MASDPTPSSEDLNHFRPHTTGDAVLGRNDYEIRVDRSDQLAVLVAPPLGVQKYRMGMALGALLLAWSGALWIGVANSDWFLGRSISLPPRQANLAVSPSEPAKSASIPVSSASSNPAKSDRLEPSTQPIVRPSAAVPAEDRASVGRATRQLQATAKKDARRTPSASVVSKENTTTSAPSALERAKLATRAVPVPETRPTTIDGWTVLAVNGDRVVLEGPNGIRNATLGDTVPELGKIDSVTRWGNRWIVATGRGLISTP
jgi:hypothetical protein